MSGLDDPGTIFAFEHRWGEVVGAAATTVGAHAAYNVCVYEFDALAALAHPVDAVTDLLRCLQSGRNVVSTSFYPLLHPPSAPKEFLDVVLPAC